MKKQILLIIILISLIILIAPNISAIEFNAVKNEFILKIDDNIKNTIGYFNKFKNQVNKFNEKFINFIKEFREDILNNNFQITSFLLLIFFLTAFRGWCSEALMEGFLGYGGVFGQITWFIGYFLFPFLISYAGFSAFGLLGIILDMDDGFWYFLLLPMFFYLLIGIKIPINSIVLPYLGPILSNLWILSRFAYSAVFALILCEILNIIDIDGNENVIFKQ
jgi:hypothetical protein